MIVDVGRDERIVFERCLQSPVYTEISVPANFVSVIPTTVTGNTLYHVPL